MAVSPFLAVDLDTWCVQKHFASVGCCLEHDQGTPPLYSACFHLRQWQNILPVHSQRPVTIENLNSQLNNCCYNYTNPNCDNPNCDKWETVTIPTVTTFAIPVIIIIIMCPTQLFQSLSGEQQDRHKCVYIQFVFNVHKSGSDQPSWDICTPAKGSCCAACGHLWTVKYDFWTKALLQTEHWCGRRFVCSIMSLARTPLATKKANLCQHFLCVEFLPL